MILLNALFGIAILLAGKCVIAIHSTHAVSVYSELLNRGVIDKDAGARVRVVPEDPLDAAGRYDVEKRLQTIGAVDQHIEILSCVALVFFAANALAWACIRIAPAAATPPPNAGP